METQTPMETETLREMHELLCDRIGSTAGWREQKAQEYPDDPRNAQAADSLNKLAKRLEELPTDHPGMVRLCRLERRIEAAEAQHQRAEAELSNETLSKYGFYGPEDGDPVEFLRQYTDELESALSLYLEDAETD